MVVEDAMGKNKRHVTRKHHMMTSSNGNIFRITGHFCGEFTGHRWIPRIKASDAGFDVFFDLRLNKRLSKQLWGWWFETPSRSLWRHCNDVDFTAIVMTAAAAWLFFGLFVSDCTLPVISGQRVQTYRAKTSRQCPKLRNIPRHVHLYAFPQLVQFGLIFPVGAPRLIGSLF